MVTFSLKEKLDCREFNIGVRVGFLDGECFFFRCWFRVILFGF